MTTDRIDAYIRAEFTRKTGRPVQQVAFTQSEVWVVVCRDGSIWTCPVTSDDPEFAFEGEHAREGVIQFEIPSWYVDDT